MPPLEYQETIDALNKILTDSNFSHLVYEPSDPRNRDIEKLVLKVTRGTSDYIQVTADANRIGRKLKETTGKSYKAYAAVGDGRSPRLVTLHEVSVEKKMDPRRIVQHKDVSNRVSKKAKKKVKFQLRNRNTKGGIFMGLVLYQEDNQETRGESLRRFSPQQTKKTEKEPTVSKSKKPLRRELMESQFKLRRSSDATKVKRVPPQKEITTGTT